MKRFIKLGLMLSLPLLLGLRPVQAADVFSSHLQQLVVDYASNPTSVTNNSANKIVKGNYVAIDITAKRQSDVAEVIKKVKSLGAIEVSSYKKQVSAIMPIKWLDKLEDYNEISWVSSNKAARRALGPPGGSVFNAADTAMLTDVVRKRFGVDGTGVTIGILSDSFDCLGGADADVATGDLPDNVTVLKEYPFCDDGSVADEGRAMMQLISDVAPGAKQLFYTAFVSATDFAAGIQALADAGANIIVDDVGYYDMPMFQEGPIAQSVNEVKERGVAFFSAAGNNARLSYENDYVPGNQWFSWDSAHDFGAAAGSSTNFYQKLTFPGGEPIMLTLQWDDPAEVAGGSGAETDLDIFLLDSNKRRIITSSQDSNIGHNPVERLFINHSGDDDVFYLYVSHRAGPAPTKLKYVIDGPMPQWPTNTTTDIQELGVANRNGEPIFVFLDGSEMTGGRVLVSFNNYSPSYWDINTEDLVISADGNVYYSWGLGLYEVGFGTEHPLYFVPDGYGWAYSPDDELMLYLTSETFIPASIDQYATNSSTIYGHPNASGAIAVGAIPYQQTPWFSTFLNDAQVEYFSSAGGTPILFDHDGDRMADPILPLKPEITAPDGADTTFFGVDTDDNGFPNFSGTSAAAPHAAAMAVLLKQAFPFITPDDIKRAMTQGALDLLEPITYPEDIPLNLDCLFPPGFDWTTGCGLIQADLVFGQINAGSGDVHMSLESTTGLVRAGKPFEYRFKVMNFTNMDMENAAIKVTELPKNVSILSIDGCAEANAATLSCELGTLLAGDTREVTLQVMPGSNRDGFVRIKAQLLTTTEVDLSKTAVELEIPFAILEGDFNYDGCVDLTDWSLLFGAMRFGGAFNKSFDLNGDNFIGILDLYELGQLFTNLPRGTACY